MTQQIIAAYSSILKKELIAAMGCTEPIAIAYAAAKCREILGAVPEKCRVRCSGNIVKNVMGVTVPNSGGLKGIDVAATLGILGGNADKDLEVLESVTQEHIHKCVDLLKKGFCVCTLEQNVENLYILIELTAGNETAKVEIRNYHKNITLIEKNGQVLYYQEPSCSEVAIKDDPDKALLNIADILEYGRQLQAGEITELLEYQLSCNLAIAEEGLHKPYGARVGYTLLRKIKQLTPETARSASWFAAAL